MRSIKSLKSKIPGNILSVDLVGQNIPRDITSVKFYSVRNLRLRCLTMFLVCYVTDYDIQWVNKVFPTELDERFCVEYESDDDYDVGTEVEKEESDESC